MAAGGEVPADLKSVGRVGGCTCGCRLLKDDAAGCRIPSRS